MYINTTTNQYPVSENEIRIANPNTSFPVPFQPPEDYSWVFSVPRPVYNPITQVALEIAPELTSKGHWEQRWQVVDLGPEEIQLNQNTINTDASRSVRFRRNQLLSESDWTQLPDAPVDKPTWANYRQQLRDITAQSGFPLEVTWPTPPV